MHITKIIKSQAYYDKRSRKEEQFPMFIIIIFFFTLLLAISHTCLFNDFNIHIPSRIIIKFRFFLYEMLKKLPYKVKNSDER